MINKYTKEFTRLAVSRGLKAPIDIIPVVVHVVCLTDENGNVGLRDRSGNLCYTDQDIPDSRIVEQINALNRDYTGTNLDRGFARCLTPDFDAISANPRIKFQLAARTPDCRKPSNPLGAITRTYTKVKDLTEVDLSNGFLAPDLQNSPNIDPAKDYVKHQRTGGHDPWPQDKYLNIWVCKLAPWKYDGVTMDIFGYGSFPGWPTATDGIVMDYRYFGTNGTEMPAENGRRLVHEIGHWLNLHHIAGDDYPPSCIDSDDVTGFVTDTPNQFIQSDFCPFKSFYLTEYRVSSTCKTTMKKDCTHNVNDHCQYFPDIPCGYDGTTDRTCTVYDTYCKTTNTQLPIWETCAGARPLMQGAGVESVKCPAFRNRTCFIKPNDTRPNYSGQEDSGLKGVLFINYMDYTHDRCAVMFTAGQATVIQSAVTDPQQRGTVANSLSLVPPPKNKGPDLWIRNSPQDLGVEPDVDSPLMFVSDDIWVNVKDKRPWIFDHENPVAGKEVTVFVRVMNRGCQPSSGGWVSLYWAKASTALGWPAPWDGTEWYEGAQMGGPIKLREQIDALAPGEWTIIPFKWTPPDPAHYASFKADRTHFCLLARIETSLEAPFGMTYPEGPNLWANIRDNNNIAMKNITIAERLAGDSLFGCVTVSSVAKRNLLKTEKRAPDMAQNTVPIQLMFGVPADEAGVKSSLFPCNVFDMGEIEVDLGELYPLLNRSKGWKNKVRYIEGSTVTILSPGAILNFRNVDPRKKYTICVKLKPHNKFKNKYNVMSLDITQLEPGPEGYRPVGGLRMTIKTIYEKSKKKS